MPFVSTLVRPIHIIHASRLQWSDLYNRLLHGFQVGPTRLAGLLCVVHFTYGLACSSV